MTLRLYIFLYYIFISEVRPDTQPNPDDLPQICDSQQESYVRCDSATQSQIGSPGSNDEPPLSPTVVSPSGSQSNPESEIVNDIGTVICANESIDKISATVNDLPAAKKYSLPFQHTQPPNELPKSFSHGCYRKFNPSWLEKYPWLRYSPRLDGVFCGPCALLLSNAKRKDKSKLVNAPFSNWVKLSDTLITHSSS